MEAGGSIERVEQAELWAEHIVIAILPIGYIRRIVHAGVMRFRY